MLSTCDPLIVSSRIYQLLNFVMKNKENIVLQNVSFNDVIVLIESSEV